MTTPDLVYKTTINTTPEKLWQAIINPEFCRQYWFGNANVADWKKGAAWKHMDMDSQKIHHLGEILEIDPPKRLVLSWGNPGDSVDISRVTFEIEPLKDGVQLTVIHGEFINNSAMAARVSGGWPKVVAAMKSWLETGKSGDADPNCSCAA